MAPVPMHMSKTLLHAHCFLQALAVAQSFRDEWPVLIISPVSLKDNWAAEAHQWLGVIDKDTAVVSNPSELERAHANNVPMVIANYELLSKSDYAPGKLSGGKHLNFKVLICDECHRIKNHKVRRLSFHTHIRQDYNFATYEESTTSC